MTVPAGARAGEDVTEVCAAAEPRLPLLAKEL
jgi:hypothetical protein